MNAKRILTALTLLCGTLSLQARPLYEKEENTVRVMSFNVRGGVGIDNVRDYDRTAAVIRKAGPDIVSVQELDSVTQRSKGKYVLQELALRTGMFGTYAAAIEFQGGKYGIGILSKEKPLQCRRIPLPGREEARVLLIAEFDDYLFCAAHFSLTAADAEASVAILREALSGVRKPVFFAGDLNSVPESPVITELKKDFKVLNDPKKPTCPADEPKDCIDYIFGYTSGGHAYTVVSRQVMDEPVASDHRPLFADVRIAADSAAIMRTQPFLQNPVGGGITVSWLTNVPVYGWVEYGTTPELGRKAHTLVDGQVVAGNKHHKIRLEGLEPGKTYYYRVCSKEITLYQAYYKEFGATACSGVRSFTMPDDRGTDFTAVVFNDLHKNKAVLNRFAALLPDIGYDFAIFNGDCIDDPKNEAEVLSFMTVLHETVGADRVPVFYLRGNHEIRNAYSIKLRDLLDYVGDRTYGAFSWGDTRFVMLDCGEDKPDDTWVYYGLNDFTSLRENQVEFLKKELASKPFKKAEKRILLHHIPIYGADLGKYHPCRELWTPLLSKAPFDISLNAHTHRFAHYEKGEDGNNYPVIVGGAPTLDGATLTVLKKRGGALTVTVLNTEGKTLLEWNL